MWHDVIPIVSQILDPYYAQLWMERTDLDREKAILRDRVQKRQVIAQDKYARLTERRYLKPLSADTIAEAVGDARETYSRAGL